MTPDDAVEPVSIDQVSLPEPRPIPDAVRSAAGEVLDGPEDRIRQAAGRSYPDLVRLRTGTPRARSGRGAAPAGCRRRGGGSRRLRGGRGGGGALRRRDERGREAWTRSPTGTRRSSRSTLATCGRSSSTRSRSPRRLGPGLTGPEAEAALGALGATLGHFPQSFEEATIGGFAATRSAGQASSGYGRFDDVVTSIELAAPAGRLRTREIPHTAAGPSLRELVLGSEGTLGVITEVSCRVRPAPRVRHYEGWMAEDFHAGREIVRDLAQRHEAPDVLRLSDEEETRVSLELAGTEGLRKRALDAYLSLRRRRGGCLMICGWEGGAG